MGTAVHAFVEILSDNRWIYVGDYAHDDEYNFALVPKNIAPESWGKFNFAVYYEASGEKGFPDDLSAALKSFINRYWERSNRPSWMTVAEMRAFYEADQDGRYAHLDFEGIASQFNLPEDQIRVVFWVDQ